MPPFIDCAVRSTLRELNPPEEMVIVVFPWFNPWAEVRTSEDSAGIVEFVDMVRTVVLLDAMLITIGSLETTGPPCEETDWITIGNPTWARGFTYANLEDGWFYLVYL